MVPVIEAVHQSFIRSMLDRLHFQHLVAIQRRGLFAKYVFTRLQRRDRLWLELAAIFREGCFQFGEHGGVRDVDLVSDAARNSGFSLDDVVAMPANNFTLIFRLGADTAGAD